MTVAAIAHSTAAGRLGIEACGQLLARGRTCVHVKGIPHGHSAAWQQGDARYQNIDDKIIDMVTGEVVGYAGDLARGIIQELVTGRLAAPEPSPQEKQAKARRVLESQYGATFPNGCGPVRAIPPAGYEWYFEGTYKAHGYDPDGNVVSFDFISGEIKRIYSLNQRQRAVDYARLLGATQAARKLKIPVATIRSWTRRDE